MLLINFKFKIILHASKEVGAIKLFLKKLDSITEDKHGAISVLFILFPMQHSLRRHLFVVG